MISVKTISLFQWVRPVIPKDCSLRLVLWHYNKTSQCTLDEPVFQYYYIALMVLSSAACVIDRVNKGGWFQLTRAEAYRIGICLSSVWHLCWHCHKPFSYFDWLP